MEKNNTRIIKEYFELLARLNKASLTKNNNELYFITAIVDQEKQLFAALSSSHKLTLCRKIRGHYWLPMKISGHDLLENYLCKIMPDCEVSENLSQCIKNKILKSLSELS